MSCVPRDAGWPPPAQAQGANAWGHSLTQCCANSESSDAQWSPLLVFRLQGKSSASLSDAGRADDTARSRPGTLDSGLGWEERGADSGSGPDYDPLGLGQVMGPLPASWSSGTSVRARWSDCPLEPGHKQKLRFVLLRQKGATCSRRRGRGLGCVGGVPKDAEMSRSWRREQRNSMCRHPGVARKTVW